MQYSQPQVQPSPSYHFTQTPDNVVGGPLMMGAPSGVDYTQQLQQQQQQQQQQPQQQQLALPFDSTFPLPGAPVGGPHPEDTFGSSYPSAAPEPSPSMGAPLSMGGPPMGPHGPMGGPPMGGPSMGAPGSMGGTPSMGPPGTLGGPPMGAPGSMGAPSSMGGPSSMGAPSSMGGPSEVALGAPAAPPVLTEAEVEVYGQLWREALAQGGPLDESAAAAAAEGGPPTYLSGAAAAAFLERSGLPQETLHTIWGLADTANEGR
ncbi:hypothetical protein, conserved [Eimeria praecox]|uniref:EH domain-containing protein n=1 Tax=Eimeria praecox TaxID=51316 RepID=U6G581_9EIME|nr:hypothetical protein, conserved [Eimeria praecox]